MDGIRRRLSYANVAATLALVLATSGGAIAATGGFSGGGKLRACVNSEGGLKAAEAGQALPARPAGDLVEPGRACRCTGRDGIAGCHRAEGWRGLKGTSGAPTNVKWAAIQSDIIHPTIAAGHGVARCGHGAQSELSLRGCI